MRDNVILVVASLAVLALATLSVEVASYPMQDSNGVSNPEVLPKGPLVLPESNRSRAIKQLLLLSLLEKLGAASNNNDRTRVKKTCLLNAGLSHSCDYRDALAAIEENVYLGSDLTPGKK